MNLDYAETDRQFLEDVRRFLHENLDPVLRDKVLNHRRLDKEDYVAWHRKVYAHGWAGASWPQAYGGTGWDAVKRHIWDEECAKAGAPVIQPFGINMVGPVIMAYGNEEQKQTYLPRILSCEDWWCQGYSEPGAGSDLASLKTRAERDGDHYVVNGQKTWTTLAQHANMIFCLVRTDPTARPQQGISFLLIDMNTPGITVRPILMLDEEHEVNEVFFDNVRVPVKNLVGVENQGWTYAKFLLGHERTNIAGVGRSKRELEFLKHFAASVQSNGRPLLEDPRFAMQVAELEIDLMALEMSVLRLLSDPSDHPHTGIQASMLKIKGTDIQQGITALMVKAAGPHALPFDPDYLAGVTEHAVTGFDDAAPLAPLYFNFRKTAIYGGSTEIQKNIIARAMTKN